MPPAADILLSHFSQLLLLVVVVVAVVVVVVVVVVFRHLITYSTLVPIPRAVWPYYPDRSVEEWNLRTLASISRAA